MNSSEQAAEAIATLAARYGQRQTTAAGSSRSVQDIVGALEDFMECVRYLNTRRSKTSLVLDSEAAVQDAVYLMLRPWIPDLVSEDPGSREGNRFTIKDFLSKSAKTVIEIKYVRDAAHGKSISSEMHDDIEMYRHHPACVNIIFFVYDPNALIPDRAALQRQIETTRVYGGVPLACKLIVRP